MNTHNKFHYPVFLDCDTFVEASQIDFQNVKNSLNTSINSNVEGNLLFPRKYFDVIYVLKPATCPISQSYWNISFIAFAHTVFADFTLFSR